MARNIIVRFHHLLSFPQNILSVTIYEEEDAYVRAKTVGFFQFFKNKKKNLFKVPIIDTHVLVANKYCFLTKK